MDIKPLVSIVIPVFNREKFVKEAIDSALAQTYDNIEIIVVDNCSTDNTWSIISSYTSNKIRAVSNNQNIGPVLNWRKGIELCQGEYVKLLFSDDMISENYIEESLALFDKDTAFVISPIKKIHNGEMTCENPFSKSEYTKGEYFSCFYTQFSDMFPVSPGSALFRKKDIENAFVCDIPTMGELNPMNNGAGIDLLIYFTVASNYLKIRISEKSYALFRVHEESFSVLDNSILHYYYRAMVFYLKKLQNKKYSNLFKAFLLMNSGKGGSFLEEYEMINGSSLFRVYYPFLLGYICCYNYLNRAKRKCRGIFLLKKM